MLKDCLGIQRKMRCPFIYQLVKKHVQGISQNLKNDDTVYSNHRSHAHYIAKGGNIAKMISRYMEMDVNGVGDQCIYRT